MDLLFKDKTVFRDLENLWSTVVRLIILIPSARNDALGQSLSQSVLLGTLSHHSCSSCGG